MTIKDLLIQEIETLPDPLVVEVLDFLRNLKTKQTKTSESLSVIQTVHSSSPQLNSSALSDYSLQGKEPYHYDDPFAPAVPLEDWDVLQ